MHSNIREQGLVGSLNHLKVVNPVVDVVCASECHHDLIVQGVVSNISEDSEDAVPHSGDFHDSGDLSARSSAFPVFDICILAERSSRVKHCLLRMGLVVGSSHDTRNYPCLEETEYSSSSSHFIYYNKVISI